MRNSFRSQSTLSINQLSTIPPKKFRNTTQVNSNQRSQSCKQKTQHYNNQLSLQLQRENSFDLSRSTLKITVKNYESESLRQQYIIKNLFIPKPVTINTKDIPKFKKEKQSYYDSRQEQFEVIKQLNNYDDLLIKQLHPSQHSQIKTCKFLSSWRANDNQISSARFDAQLMQFSGFSYSPITRNTRIDKKPLYGVPTQKQSGSTINKSFFQTMNK
ncbi:hypothetical protein SS50377_25698 [Spironucleus salmonicida]|uniref:Uncharacterized protein n=1 Tax=Spironucleus salmonicida TaxID=348837 RepID=V6LGA6_9EUKA|nr:hypothetical protein SS50377_25698 [Spironucleus salmonicida]|eukprot:EST42701.1 Hypothetical protein SS50377_17722 [Spironucleus salmonicida]